VTPNQVLLTAPFSLMTVDNFDLVTVSSYDVSTGNDVTITLLWSVVLITEEYILLKKVHKELI